MAHGPQVGAVQKVAVKPEEAPQIDFKIFSDKKMFTVDQVYNHCNDRIIVDQGESATPVNKTKHTAGIMVL